MLKHDLKAKEYRDRALAASVAADHASLDQVRRQHRAAAASWSDLAQAEEARALSIRPPHPGLAR